MLLDPQRTRFPRRRELYGDAVVLEAGRPHHLARHLADHRLRELHHVLVVREREVQLEHGELGVVRAVDPLVAEVVSDLVHAVEVAHDEPLQVQLVRDAQEHLLVEAVVAGRKGPRQSPAVERLQDRRLDLEEAARVQPTPEGGNDAAADTKHLPHLGIHREVGVALPVACRLVAEAAVYDAPAVRGHLLLAEGERTQRLREQGERLGPHGDLSAARAEDGALDPDPVAEIEQVHERRARLAEEVAPQVELEPAVAVPDVGEGAPAEVSVGEYAARNPHVRHLGPVAALRLQTLEGLERLAQLVRTIKSVRERLHAEFAQPGQFVEAVPHRLRPVLGGVPARHANAVAALVRRRVARAVHRPAPPDSRRKAWMKPSISPSNTASTLPTSTFVRWSFTILYGCRT